MAHDDEEVELANLGYDVGILADKISDSIGTVLDQALEESIGNKLDYIGDQLRDIKESLQKIAASIKEVSDR